MPNEPDVPKPPESSVEGASDQVPGDHVAALRKQVTVLKWQARLLFQRFERGELSPGDGRAQAERLGREVVDAERRLEELSRQRRARS